MSVAHFGRFGCVINLLIAWIYMPKVNLDSGIFERARSAAEKAGYSSVDEFVVHAIERELERLKVDEAEAQVADQLKGLGYIE